MNGSTYIPILVSIACVVGCTQDVTPTVQPHSTADQGRLLTPVANVSNTNIDLGVVRHRQLLAKCITIRNGGSNMLRVALTPTGCRAPIPSFDGLAQFETEIEAGDSDSISILIISASTPGRHSAMFEILTDDPRNPRIPVTIQYAVNGGQDA